MKRILLAATLAVGLSGCIDAAVTFNPSFDSPSTATLAVSLLKGASEAGSTGHDDLLIAFPQMLTPDGNVFEPTRETPQEEYEAASQFAPTYDLLYSLASEISQRPDVESVRLAKRVQGETGNGQSVVVRYTEMFIAGEFLGPVTPGSASANGTKLSAGDSLEVAFRDETGEFATPIEFTAETIVEDTGDDYIEINVSENDFDEAFADMVGTDLRMAIFLQDSGDRVTSAVEIDALLPVGLSTGSEFVAEQQQAVAEDCSNALEMAARGIMPIADNSDEATVTDEGEYCTVAVELTEPTEVNDQLSEENITWETTEEELAEMIANREAEISGFYGYVLNGLAAVDIHDAQLVVAFGNAIGLDEDLEAAGSSISFAFEGQELAPVSEGSMFISEKLYETFEIPAPPAGMTAGTASNAASGSDSNNSEEADASTSTGFPVMSAVIFLVAVAVLGGAGYAASRLIKSRREITIVAGDEDDADEN